MDPAWHSVKPPNSNYPRPAPRFPPNNTSVQPPAPTSYQDDFRSEVSPRPRVQLHSNRHSMAFKEGFNPAAFSQPAEGSMREEKEIEKDNETVEARRLMSREDRNNNRTNRNNLKNNISITIPSDNEAFRTGMVSPRSPASPLTPSNRVTPIPSLSIPSSPSGSPNRNTPTPVITPPISPVVLNPSPTTHFIPAYPHAAAHSSASSSPQHAPTTTTTSTLPFPYMITPVASHFTFAQAPHNPSTPANPLSITMGKYAHSEARESDTHKPPSTLSSKSAVGSNFSHSSSEGHINLQQYNAQKRRSAMLSGSGGFTRDLLHGLRNSPIRPSAALSGSGGVALGSTSSTSNSARNGQHVIDTPRSVIHNIELGFSEISYNFDEYEAVDLFSDRTVSVKEACAIAEKLKTNTTVRTLLVKSQMIEDKGAFAFADMLQVNTTLEDLSLRSESEVFTYMEARKDITFKGAFAIARALWDNFTLTKLDLSNNYMGDETAKYFGELMVKNNTLTYLNLSDNNIASCGGMLYGGLLRNSSLKFLISQRNTLSDGASDVLCTALRYNCTLVCLDLDESRQAISANPFLDMLRFNFTLCELRLGLTDNKKIGQLDQKLEQNRKLQDLKYQFRGDSPISSSPELQSPSTTPTVRSARSASLLKHMHSPFNDGVKKISKIGAERSLRRSAPNSVIQSKSNSPTPVAREPIQLTANFPALQYATGTQPPVSQDFLDGLKVTPTRLDISNLNANTSQINEILDRTYRSKRDTEEIKEIYLNKNQLCDLPTKVPSFFGLTTLVLSQNAFNSLDPEIVNCRHLLTLDLSHNQLRDLPGSFAKLHSLSTLDISDNRFPIFPQEILQLTNLQTLYINRNQIPLIPPEVSKLQALSTLDFSCNLLTSVPPELCKTKNLEFLYLQNNQIATLPREINKLLLRELTLDSNKLEYLPVEMAKLLQSGGMNVLSLRQNALSAFTDKERLDSKSLCMALQKVEAKSQWTNVVKLILCGDGNVGKTTLLKSFMNDGSNCSFGENIATDGIDFHEWKVSLVKGKQVKFKTLDFAGQQLYYHTHQFFVSTDTAYLVVFNLANENLARVEYWLQTLAISAKDSPIIIVGTNSDDKKCTKSYIKSVLDGMRRIYAPKFPSIVDFVTVSNKTGKGIKELMHLLGKVAEQWKLAGISVPPNYVLIGRRLRVIKNLKAKSESPTMSMEEFEKLVVEFGVPKDQTMQVLQSLNRCGEIVYLGDKEKNSALSDMIFLDCKWLANVMSSVISLKTRVKDGILSENYLVQIWRPFPIGLHEVLIKLLEKFEIMYALPTVVYRSNLKMDATENESKYLVPCFLSEERPPSMADVWPVSADAQTPQLMRYFEFHFLPLGFFSRLIIRMSVLFSPLCFWQNGMVIRLHETPNGPDEDRALLEYNPLLFSLKIHVRGEKASKFMGVLTENIDILVSGWFPGQLSCVRIPCTHCIRANSFDPFMFTLAECQRVAALGGQYVHCRGIKPVRIELIAGDVTLSGLEHLHIEFEAIEIKREIGKGSFARVYEGVYKGETVAVKRIELFGTEMSTKMIKAAAKEEIEEETMEKFAEFRREVLVMSSIKHPNLVKLKGICVAPFCMIAEYVPYGDLFHFLRKDITMNWKLRFKIALDIANGIKFLHNSTPPIIHRDLKSPNIMMCGLDETYPICAKVADFGLSVKASSSLKKREVHNACWLAPEIMREQHYTEKVDVYSFGIVLWELFTRQNPFDEYRHLHKFNAQLEAVIVQGLRPTIPPNCHQIYSRLIEECWHDDPNKRPSFDQIVSRLVSIQAVIDPVSHKASSFLLNAPNARNTPPPVMLETPYAQLQETLKSSTIITPKLVEEVSERLCSFSGVHCIEVVDNTIWCGCMDGSIEIWHKYARNQIAKIQAHTEDVWCLKLIGNVVWSSSQDRTVSIWDKNIYKDSVFKPMRTLKQKDIVVCMEPAGKRVWMGSSLGDLRVFNKKDYKCVRDLKVDGAVGCMLFLPPNKIWIGTDKLIVILDTNSTACVTLHGHTRMVHSLVRVDNTVWSCSSDKTIRVWSELGEPLKVISGHSARVFGLLNVGDVHVWSSSWDASIMIWDAKNYTFLQELKGLHNDAVSALAAVEKDTKVEWVWSASWDKSIGCWKYKAPPNIAIRHVVIDREGYVMKQGGEIKTWKNRYFILSKGNLSYYEKQYDEEPIHSVNIRGCLLHDVQETAGKRFCFSIETDEPRKNIDRRVYVMSCESQADKDAWLAALRLYCSD